MLTANRIASFFTTARIILIFKGIPHIAIPSDRTRTTGLDDLIFQAAKHCPVCIVIPDTGRTVSRTLRPCMARAKPKDALPPGNKKAHHSELFLYLPAPSDAGKP